MNDDQDDWDNVSGHDVAYIQIDATTALSEFERRYFAQDARPIPSAIMQAIVAPSGGYILPDFFLKEFWFYSDFLGKYWQMEGRELAALIKRLEAYHV